jgi:CubicO group peptidase (beta-lactamase class C family)
MHRPNFLLFLSLLASSAHADSLEQQLDAYLADVVKNIQFSGTVVLMKNGEIVANKAYGYADFAAKTPNTPDTRFCVASITKSVTISLLNLLESEKRISFEDTLTKFIPDFPGGDKITVAQLALHQAGIPHRVTTPDNENVPRTLDEMVGLIAKAPRVGEPGKQRLYSSAGYTVLAKVLEVAGGKPFPQQIREKILTPAGVTSISEYDPELKRAKEHMLQNVGVRPSPYKDYSFLIGAGSLVSTAADVLKFYDAACSGKLGKSIAEGFPGKVARGNGSTNGNRCFVYLDKETRSGFVVASNLGSGVNDILSADLPKLLNGEPVPPLKAYKPTPLNLTAEQLQEFVGDYTFQGRELNMTVQNGVLMSDALELLPVGKDHFFCLGMFNDLYFGRDEKGKIKSVRWVGQRGEESTWELVVP